MSARPRSSAPWKPAVEATQEVVVVGDDSEPTDDDDIPEAPPGWLTVEELGQRIFLDQLSRSTARALIEILADRGESPDALMVALLAVILQVQEQVDEPSKDLISFVLSSVPGVASRLTDAGGRFPITEDLWLRRWLDNDNRFTVLAPRSWLEPMGLEIKEALERLAEGDEG